MRVRIDISLLERCKAAVRARDFDFTGAARSLDLLAALEVTLDDGPDWTRWRYGS